VGTLTSSFPESNPRKVPLPSVAHAFDLNFPE
jgi:hypothetical protein